MLTLGCSGGGSSGGGRARSTCAGVVSEAEPNGQILEALPLGLDEVARGSVQEAGDLDFWSLALTGGMVIQIELFAVRLDQQMWAAADNVPRLTLFSLDGVSKLLEHDRSGNVGGAWSWGSHDLDSSSFTVPVTGTYFVGVTQDDTTRSGGAYALRVSSSKTPVTQVEAELGAAGTNDSDATAEPITPGVIRGFHAAGEDDFYSFTLTQPGVVLLELETYRLGHFGGAAQYFDSELELYEADGTTSVHANDDHFFSDSGLSARFQAAGTYYVRVGESGGPADADYYLTYDLLDASTSVAESEPNEAPSNADTIAYGDLITGTSGPGDVDMFSYSGTAGDMVRVLWFDQDNDSAAVDDIVPELVAANGDDALSFDSDDDGIPNARTILLTSDTFFVRVHPTAVPTDYAFQLVLLKGAGYEAEPNDEASQSNPLDSARRAAGTIVTPTDKDYFAFTASQCELVTLVAYASDVTASAGVDYDGHGSDLVPRLMITDKQGKQLAASDQGLAPSTESPTDGLPSCQVSFVAPKAGTYHLEVSGGLGMGGPTHYYVVERRSPVTDPIHVSALTGAPGNPGTREAPLDTISAGYALARAESAPAVLVAIGGYDESPLFDGPVDVLGGYDPLTWERVPGEYSIVNTDNGGAKARSIVAEVTISGLDIRAADGVPQATPSVASSSVALDVRFCGPGLVVEDCILRAGLGAPGASGADGAAGAAASSAGGSGDNGYTAAVFDPSPPPGGAGGTSADSGASGGVGGSGGDLLDLGFGVAFNGALPGGSGQSGGCVRAIGGAGGLEGNSFALFGAVIVSTGSCQSAGDGSDGGDGADGQEGSHGSLDPSPGGIINPPSGDWLPKLSDAGGAGTSGCGGGGGGGGGGAVCAPVGLLNQLFGLMGAGGGGGGAGGLGGQAGQGSLGGGASFATYLFDASPTFFSCTFIASQGGVGGAGGDGGAGGTGAIGGAGGAGFYGSYSAGAIFVNVAINLNSGNGGDGGPGGTGGGGGGGAGGHGGPSYCLFQAGSSFPVGLQDPEHLFLYASGGAGGLGGYQGNTGAPAPGGATGPSGIIGSPSWAPLVIHSVTPPSAAAGTKIQLQGSDFVPGLSLEIDGSPVTLTWIDPGRIEFQYPAHTRRDAVLTLTDPATGESAFAALNPTPAISALAPESGRGCSANPIVITGTGFTDGSTVRIRDSRGGEYPCAFTILTPTRISCVTPALLPGVVDILVTTPGGARAVTQYSFELPGS